MLTLNTVPSSWFGGVDESKIAAVGAAYPADPVVVCPKISLQTQEISDHANYPFQLQGSPFDTGDKYNLTYISPPPSAIVSLLTPNLSQLAIQAHCRFPGRC